MPTRITNATLSRSLMADLADVSNRLAQTQRKLSSGKEVTRPSDDPFAASRAIALRGSIEATRQLQRNVGEAVAWSNVTETALARMTDAAQRARELVVQGSSDTASPVSREAIATELESLIATLKQEANASYGGRFVFSGTATDTKPYDVNGGDGYLGNGAAIVREIGPGVNVQVNAVGSDILGNGQGAADDKLLHVLRDAVDHLRGGTPADAAALRGTDLSRLTAGLDELTRVRSVIGATTNRLDTANLRLLELEETTTKLLSETEDADMARALVDFSMQQSVYQSALRAGANVIQASLLDFLR